MGKAFTFQKHIQLNCMGRLMCLVLQVHIMPNFKILQISQRVRRGVPSS